MTDIYDDIVAGLTRAKTPRISIEGHLQSLQGSVRLLRKAYYSSPVSVAYSEHNIQSAYLVAYFPHYYQLIYNILNNDTGTAFKDKSTVNLGFIGGGPGSEVYGTIKFIQNNCSWIRKVVVTIFDINAETWRFSHDIVQKDIISQIPGIEKLTIDWRSRKFNLVNDTDIAANKDVLQALNLLVIQNCINEIIPAKHKSLKENVVKLFRSLPAYAYLLISDLTSSVRPLMKQLESEIDKDGQVNFKVSTLKQSIPSTTISVHHQPNKIIRENLMTGADGLIPRKNLKYDYVFVSKVPMARKIKDEAIGFMALYAPLKENRVDANDYVHKKSFIGLDFGTSTTVVSCACLVDDHLNVAAIPIVQKDKEGAAMTGPLVPSVIAVDNNHFMVGKYAEERKAILTPGKNIWYGFKEGLLELKVTSYPHSVLGSHATKRISTGFEALKIFFEHIRENVNSYLSENNLPKDVEYSVTIPASFDYERKQVIRECLVAASIPYADAPFIDEPTAALINYFFESEDPLAINDDSKIALILDVGAGTVDVSIMRLEKQLEGIASKLLAAEREGFIGGNLLDEMLAKNQIKRIKQFEDLDPSEKSELMKQCENLKIKLCKDVQTDASVNFALDAKASSIEKVALKTGKVLENMSLPTVEITFQGFKGIMNEYWSKIVATIELAVLKSGIEKDEIDIVILNGGGSRNPYIQNFASTFFEGSQIVRPDNIQEHVSRGAALNSFVLNSYGKQIVSSILSSPLMAWDGRQWIDIIPEGESLPTLEIELFPEESNQGSEKYLGLRLNEQASYFAIPTGIEVKKLFVSVNIDSEPECAVITKDKIIDAERRRAVSISELIKLKPV